MAKKKIALHAIPRPARVVLMAAADMAGTTVWRLREGKNGFTCRFLYLVMWYLMSEKKRLHYSSIEVGRFCNRDHSVVLGAKIKIRQLLDCGDAETLAQVRELEARCASRSGSTLRDQLEFRGRLEALEGQIAVLIATIADLRQKIALFRDAQTGEKRQQVVREREFLRCLSEALRRQGIRMQLPGGTHGYLR